MAITFKCNGCGKTLNIAESHAGKHGKCPACGSHVTVPRQAAPAEAPELVCRNCREPILPKWKACPACGANIGAPAEHQESQPAEISSALRAPAFVTAGDNSVVKATVDASMRVSGCNAGAAEFLPNPSNIPAINAGDNSVIKAEIDASTHHTNQYAGDQVVGDKIVQHITQNESAIAAIFRATGIGTLKLQELERQIDSIDLTSDPIELKALFRRHMAVIEEESFGDTIRLLTRGYLAVATYGLMGPSKASKERKLRLRICRLLIDRLEDNIASNPQTATILADCRSRYDRSVKRSQVRLWIVLGVVGALVIFNCIFFIILAAMSGGRY